MHLQFCVSARLCTTITFAFNELYTFCWYPITIKPPLRGYEKFAFLILDLLNNLEKFNKKYFFVICFLLIRYRWYIVYSVPAFA